MEFADNDDVLRLLEGKPQGILSLLKEESTLKTGTGLKLGNRYRQAFKGNDRFALPRYGTVRYGKVLLRYGSLGTRSTVACCSVARLLLRNVGVVLSDLSQVCS